MSPGDPGNTPPLQRRQARSRAAAGRCRLAFGALAVGLGVASCVYFVMIERPFWPGWADLAFFAANGLPALVGAFAGTLRADGSLAAFGRTVGVLSLAYWCAVGALCVLVREGLSLVAVLTMVMVLSGAVGVILYAAILGP